jgi:IPT/TIG domain
VSTLGASHLTANSAQLNANVNPEGSPTSCVFEWGTNVSFGKTTPCSSSPGEGEIAVPVSATISGLTANTTYVYRVVATNAFGTEFGNKASFITESGGQPPAVTRVGPSKGGANEHKTVKITGTGFTGTTEVLFGEVPATSVTIKSGTKLVVVTPTEAPGTVDVRVKTPAGESEIVTADHYTFK